MGVTVMKQQDICDIYCFDKDNVNDIKGKMVGKDFSKMAQLFKALADENRAKISYALCQGGELCVCDLANIIDSSVATASHHLRFLHRMGLVTYRKEGKMAFYSLEDNGIKELVAVALSQNRMTAHA